MVVTAAAFRPLVYLPAWSNRSAISVLSCWICVYTWSRRWSILLRQPGQALVQDDVPEGLPSFWVFLQDSDQVAYVVDRSHGRGPLLVCAHGMCELYPSFRAGRLGRGFPSPLCCSALLTSSLVPVCRVG